MIEIDHIEISDPGFGVRSSIRFPVITNFEIVGVRRIAAAHSLLFRKVKIDTASGLTCMPLTTAWSLLTTRPLPRSKRDATDQSEVLLTKRGAEAVRIVQADGSPLDGYRIECLVRIWSSTTRPNAGAVFGSDVTFLRNLNEPVAGQNGVLEHFDFFQYSDHSVLKPIQPAYFNHLWP